MSEQPAEKPAAEAPAAQPPVPAQADPRDAEIARLRQQVTSLQGAQRAPEDGEVAIKVEGPHSEFHFGNLHLGREFTAVPARLAAAIHSAAHEAGVLLTQKES
jgi:hypothetical protein